MMSLRQLYKCATCWKRFKNRLDLNRHRRKHSQARPYACRYSGCEKVFSHLTQLQQHLRQHTGQRPYHCLQCGSAFLQHLHLKHHSCRNKHSFTCHLCKQSFPQQCRLTHHLVISHKIPFRKRVRKSKPKTKIKCNGTQTNSWRQKQHTPSQFRSVSQWPLADDSEHEQQILLKIRAGTSMTILRPKDSSSQLSPDISPIKEPLNKKPSALFLRNDGKLQQCSFLLNGNTETGTKPTWKLNGTHSHIFRLWSDGSENVSSKSTSNGNIIREKAISNMVQKSSDKTRQPQSRQHMASARNPTKSFPTCNSNLQAGYRILRKYCKYSNGQRKLKRHRTFTRIKNKNANRFKIVSIHDIPQRNGVVIEKDKLGRFLGSRQLDSLRSETTSVCDSPRKEYSIVPCSNGSYSPGSLKVKLSPRKTVHQLETSVDSNNSYNLPYTCNLRLVEENEKQRKQVLSEDSDVYEASPCPEKDYDGGHACVNDSGVEILSSSSCNRSNGNSVQLDENSSSSHFNMEDSNVSLDSPASTRFVHLPQSSICDKCGGLSETNNNSQSPGKCICFALSSVQSSSLEFAKKTIVPVVEVQEEDSLQQYLSESLDSIPKQTVTLTPLQQKPASDLYQQQFLTFLSKVDDNTEVEKQKEEEVGEERSSPKTSRLRGKRSKQGRKSSCACCLGLSPKKRKHSHCTSDKKPKLPRNYKQFIRNTKKLLDLQEKLHQLFIVLFPECTDLITASKVGTDKYEDLLNNIMSSFDMNDPGGDVNEINMSVRENVAVSKNADFTASNESQLQGRTSGTSIFLSTSDRLCNQIETSPALTQGSHSLPSASHFSDSSKAAGCSLVENNNDGGRKTWPLSREPIIPCVNSSALDGDESDSNRTIDLDLEREVQLVRSKIAKSNSLTDDSDEENAATVPMLSGLPGLGPKSFINAFNCFRFNNVDASKSPDQRSSTVHETQTLKSDLRSEGEPSNKEETNTERELEIARVSLCKNPKDCLRRLQSKLGKLIQCLLPDINFKKSVFRSYDNLNYLLDLTILSNTDSRMLHDEQFRKIMLSKSQELKPVLEQAKEGSTSEESRLKINLEESVGFDMCSEVAMETNPADCRSLVLAQNCSQSNSSHANSGIENTIGDEVKHLSLSCFRPVERKSDLSHPDITKLQKTSLTHLTNKEGEESSRQAVTSSEENIVSSPCSGKLLSPRRKSADKNIFELLQPTHMGAALS